MNLNEKKISLEEIHKIELDIMDYIHNICEENQIRYYLVGGTLIGAIRHKGFIPWDDDMDIDMPRKDYERFKQVLKENPSEQFFFLNEDTEKNYFSFGKMIDTRTRLIEKDKDIQPPNMGVYIDIFPVDGAPGDEMDAHKHYKAVKRINKLRIQYAYKKAPYTTNIVRWFYRCLVWRISRIFGIRWINKKEKSLLNKYIFDESKKVCNYFGAYGEREIIPITFFGERCLTEFEGRQYYITKNYDEFLRKMYGDYMKLPPVEERVSRHDTEVYWK